MRILFLGNDPNPISVACVDALAREGEHEIVVAAGDPRGPDPWKTLRRAWRQDGPGFVVRASARLVFARLALVLRRLGLGFLLGPPRSVSEVAVVHGLRCVECGRVNSKAARERFGALAPDLVVVAAFGQILKRALIELPRLGCLNVHPSLLPAYRGPNPFFWVLENGEVETGVTVHWIDEGVDTGDIVLQASIPIEAHDDERSLRDRCAPLGAELLVDALDRLARGTAPREPQSAEGASYYSHPPRGASTL